MRVAVTDPMTSQAKHSAYVEYLCRWLPGEEIAFLSYATHRPEDVTAFDGLVLTGGVDVDPAFYAREDARHFVEEPDFRRDGFEVELIRAAVRQSLPILGICRGMQILNVAMGGTLVPDLETAGFGRHTTGRDETQRTHRVSIEEGTLLRSVAGVDGGLVSTYHHQAVDVPAPGLRCAARSPDGVIEALEWDQPARNAFLLLVQWHPERMEPKEDPLAGNLLQSFFTALRSAAGDRAAPGGHVSSHPTTKHTTTHFH